MRGWVTNVETTHYVLGSAMGPHPYPTIVREFQSVIGREAREQIMMEVGRLPDMVIACVGGGSNFAGLTFPFIGRQLRGEARYRVIAVEPVAAPSLTRGEYRYDFGDTGGGSRPSSRS